MAAVARFWKKEGTTMNKKSRKEKKKKTSPDLESAFPGRSHVVGSFIYW